MRRFKTVAVFARLDKDGKPQDDYHCNYLEDTNRNYFRVVATFGRFSLTERRAARDDGSWQQAMRFIDSLGGGE